MVSSALIRVGADVEQFHGRMSMQERDGALFAFRRPRRSGPATPRVLVAQVRCASCGLNLQFASRGYLMRPQWNPAIERQAVGRLHRSGQTRPVVVLRLVAEGTVDERTLRRQRGKLACIADVMRDDEMQRVMGR